MKQFKQQKNFTRKNEQIRCPRVLVIYEGNKLGEMPIREAQIKARDFGLDLVEVSPNSSPPVCLIVDYGKYQYEKSKKHSVKPHVIKEKEFSLRYVISEHDLQTKMNQAKKYLDKGDRVKIVVKFNARENAHKDQGWLVIEKAIKLLEDHGTPEKPPIWEKNRIAVKLKKENNK